MTLSGKLALTVPLSYLWKSWQAVVAHVARTSFPPKKA